jgi:hypothetical protein
MLAHCEQLLHGTFSGFLNQTKCVFVAVLMLIRWFALPAARKDWGGNDY